MSSQCSSVLWQSGSLKDSLFSFLSSVCSIQNFTIQLVLHKFVNGLDRGLLGKEIACAEQDIERSMFGIDRPDFAAQVTKVAIGWSHYETMLRFCSNQQKSEKKGKKKKRKDNG